MKILIMNIETSYKEPIPHWLELAARVSTGFV